MQQELYRPLRSMLAATVKPGDQASIASSQEEIAIDNLTETVIDPARGWLAPNLREVWGFRDLLLLLIWRDISARYRQSIAGYGWAVIRPVVSMLIFTFIFGSVAKIETGDIPYPLFAFSGLVPWMYFSAAISAASTSVVSGSALISKVYFPRLILPLASVASGTVDLLIQLAILVFLMAFYGISPGWQFVAFPLFILVTVGTALAGGLWLTALNVKYRDVGMAMPFFIQTWMWLSPVAYPSNLVSPSLQPIYALNPMVGVIEGFRWSLLGSETPNWTAMGMSLVITLLFLVSGLLFFRKTEATFADVI